MKTREEALALLYEWVKSDSLRKHCIAVGAAMEKYALVFDVEADDVDVWWTCGLLHDMDYEKYPDINVHPIMGCKELRKHEYDERIIESILSHNEKTGIKRYNKMSKTLFAVDELCGLIMALAKVRPENFSGMDAESVKKVMKKDNFAASINRGDIQKGIEELGVKEDEHYCNVIEALGNVKKELGF